MPPRWPGELSLGIAFTKAPGLPNEVRISCEAAPLGCLKLRGGMLGFSSMPSGCGGLVPAANRAHTGPMSAWRGRSTS